MPNDSFGQICELSYHSEIGPCLPRLVRELHVRLMAMGVRNFTMTWDCDDIAYFEVSGQRILLAYAERPRADIASKILISVGPTVGAPAHNPNRLSHAALCRRIVRSLDQRHPSDQRQMRSYLGVLTPERVDDILYSTAALTPKTAEPVDFVSKTYTSRDAMAARSDQARTSIVRIDEKALRAAIIPTGPAKWGKILTFGLLINGLSLSVATAAPVVVLGLFGSNLIGALIWASTHQLPR